ncbi:MAG: penicillin acylase family protein, partial [Salinisphaera sp.]|nr:penicillin acylase family protein [Salinisphaera sp.]
GDYDWQGFIGLERHPQVTNPERGYLSSWNNRPARGWWAADANASYGPSHRNEMLAVRLQKLVAQGNVTRANVVEAMGDAATVDLRGQEVLPPALALLEAGPLTDAQQQAVDLLRGWVADGAMRRDRDQDGAYDQAAAVALMNAWYDPMIEAVLPQIVAVEDAMIMGRGNPPGPMGSAYQSGYYGYLERVFRMALGQAQKSYRLLRCSGVGADPDACRGALQTSLDQALAALGGIANRANWDAQEARDRIVHRPLGLSAVPPIDWQNRPTFQQVVEFTDHR